MLDRSDVREVLEDVAGGRMSVDDAIDRLKLIPFEDLGFAKVDHHRSIRQGVPEVVYGAGKTVEQIAAAADSFNYEFVCGISRRVPRIYVQGGKTVHSVHYLLDSFS